MVDDAQLNRELLQEVLRDSYLVDTAQDGEQAIRQMKENADNIAALLLDLHMPHMDGFTVLSEMNKHGWIGNIPVLVISGEFAPEVETRCFELGVSDFIHKPFVSSIVKNRVKNSIELFSCKNQLEQTVHQQAETLKKQNQIIQIQTQRLQAAEPFNRLMMEYSAAIMEVETRLKVLNAEFSQTYKRNPFESIKSRLKTPQSIYEKLARKGLPISVDSIRENLTDVAGLRVICSFPDDIYRLARLFTVQDNIRVLREKDYIKNPKPNGYRSLHLILEVQIYLSNACKYVKTEVQFRTIAMDFWASLEHKLKYKQNVDNAEEIARQLKACADSIETLDYQMQAIRNQIDASKG